MTFLSRTTLTLFSVLSGTLWGASLSSVPAQAAPRLTQVSQTRADELLDRAARLYLQKRYVEALSVIRQATQVAPRYARAYVGLGTVYGALNQREAAGRAFRQALALRPDSDDAVRARAGLRHLGLPIKAPRNQRPLLASTLLPQRAALKIAPFKARVTIVVSSESEFKTIGEAVARALPNTRIEVKAGTYRENLIIDKPLQIVGESRDSTIIESTDEPIFSLRASRVALASLTLKARVASTGDNRFHAVEVARGQVTLDNCKVSSESRVAVSVHGDDTSATIRNCEIGSARTSSVLVYNGAQLDIVNSTLAGGGFAGLEVVEQGNVFARSTTLAGNRGGLVVQKDGFVQMLNSKVVTNGWEGVRVKSFGALILRNTPVEKNPRNISVEKSGILRKK